MRVRNVPFLNREVAKRTKGNTTGELIQKTKVLGGPKGREVPRNLGAGGSTLVKDGCCETITNSAASHSISKSKQKPIKT